MYGQFGPHVEIEEMVGQVFYSVKEVYDVVDGDILEFKSHNKIYRFYHEIECCESVAIEDICGDLKDLEGVPLLLAEEISNQEDISTGSQTWTFYNFSTVKGSVTVRWYGTSNGYYSEHVQLAAAEIEGEE